MAKTHTVFTAETLHLIPDLAVRAKAQELLTWWSNGAGSVPFPGVATGGDAFNAGQSNYYVNWFALPADLGAMCRNSSKAPYTKRGKVPAGQYPYGTVTVGTALSRAKRGLPLFA